MKPHTLMHQALAIGSISGLLMLSACANSGSGSSPSEGVSETVTETVTETDPAPATDPGSETTTEIAQNTQCATSDLDISTGQQQGAAGSILLDINFTNAGSQECTLQGFPGISFVGMDNGTQIGAPAARENSNTPVITLEPGESTYASIRISRAENYDAAECSLEPVDGIRIYPPGETAAAYLPLDGINGCDNDALELLSVKAVGD
ncbi:hypothetical protein N24_2122 [Corynebacterium suranareeae]|uniref:DUF4232 domain-containing protein n=1 Tax=Corynebacterium suranareeae TaxID=2506452 RepID=A0A160PRV0_9CORY|nr:DUF4232 domain-containing protein [Corynebacterium suranareeae]BAU96384.1 hypothetical protein N24_2122 [Corynebacterium suranareeae]